FSRQSQRQERGIDKSRRLATGLNRSCIEQAGLISPAMPARRCFAGEQFKIRASDKPLNTLAHAIRLSAMLATLLYDKTPYVFRSALRLAAGCQQALFRVGTGPIAKAGEVVRIVSRRAVEFHPIERDRLELKTPALNQVESARQKR